MTGSVENSPQNFPQNSPFSGSPLESTIGDILADMPQPRVGKLADLPTEIQIAVHACLKRHWKFLDPQDKVPDQMIAEALMDVWLEEVQPQMTRKDVDILYKTRAIIPVAEHLAHLRPKLAGIPAGYGSRQRGIYRLLNVDWSAGLTGNREVSQEIAEILRDRFVYLDKNQTPVVKPNTTYNRWKQKGFEYLAEGLRRFAQQVTAKVESSVLPMPSWSLPNDYVEPQQMGHLYSLLTEARSDGQPTFQGVVLHGLSGAGKTTIALALAKSGVVNQTFQTGVLWLDGKVSDLVREARRKVGIAYGISMEMRQEDWERWIQAYERRLLIVIDDLTDTTHLRDILKCIGPQVTVLVTTQRGVDVVEEMRRFLGSERLAEVEIKGLKHRARQFLERVSGDALSELEWELVEEEIGDVVGWHPEGLRLAAQMARNDLLTWRDVALDLQDVEGSTILARLERWVDRHWQRMPPQEQAQGEQLLSRMERGGPFGVLFASAAWNVEIGQARVRLSRMEGNGLIERMADHPVERWWSEMGEQWRALPVVYRLKGKRAESERAWPQKIVERIKRSLEWRQRQRLRAFFPKMPVSFGVVTAGALLCFAPLKAVIEAVLILGDSIWRGRGWRQRWNTWTIVNKVESHWKRRWEQMGWQPTEELGLLYKQNNLLVYALFLVQVMVFLPVFWPQDTLVDVVGPLMAAAVGFAVAYRGAWRVWVAGLYGVRTWDLETMLRISLWITHRLRWISPLRREQGVLREALSRVMEDDG